MRGFVIKNGDWSLNGSGCLDTVSGSEKVKRDIYKRLTTDKHWGGNDTPYFRYNKDYGTKLNNASIYTNMSRKDQLSAVNNAVGEALNDLVNSQKADTQLPIDEVIDTFDYYSYFDQQNAANIKCKISVKLLNGTIMDLGTFSQPIVTQDEYRLPGISFKYVDQDE